MNNKTILAICYAVDPYKGSEDGMGWNFILQIARFRKVFAITRENNQSAIEKYMSEFPNQVYSNITFLYFDLPYWMRFWKRGHRGAMLYFYLWQRAIVSFIKKKKLHFDIAHNVNFHNDWTPSFLWKLNVPMVWGPIGHHPIIPNQYLKQHSFQYRIKEKATWFVKQLFWKLSPALRNTVNNSAHILGMNSSVASLLKLREKSYSIMPSVATDDFFSQPICDAKCFNVISVGRFVPLKGFDLTLRSFINFLSSIPPSERQNCKLTIVGTGPEKANYEALIKKNKVSENVEIVEWIDRKQLMERYKTSALFLFPSHEGAGMVVAEALSFGLPVVCLDNQGPGEFINSRCGVPIPMTDYQETIDTISKALLQLYQNPEIRLEKSVAARQHYLNHFTWQSRGEHLNHIYQQILR
jgi:glycosyltransferase involved in cell wall biosynthesis